MVGVAAPAGAARLVDRPDRPAAERGVVRPVEGLDRAAAAGGGPVAPELEVLRVRPGRDRQRGEDDRVEAGRLRADLPVRGREDATDRVGACGVRLVDVVAGPVRMAAEGDDRAFDRVVRVEVAHRPRQ